jgi:NADH:ubiquinone oxidoreductase subunit C
MIKCFKSFSKLATLIPIYVITQMHNENVILVSQSWLLVVISFLKKHINYKYSLLTCISGVDLLDKVYRYSIVYEFLSLTFNSRIRIKVLLSNLMTGVSITSLFKNANWWEREIWDLFGIYFINHPDMRRILTDYGFEGNPLKKDFPLFGFIELRYNESKKKVVVEPIVLVQEFKVFNFEMPW